MQFFERIHHIGIHQITLENPHCMKLKSCGDSVSILYKKERGVISLDAAKRSIFSSKPPHSPDCRFVDDLKLPVAHIMGAAQHNRADAFSNKSDNHIANRNIGIAARTPAFYISQIGNGKIRVPICKDDRAACEWHREPPCNPHCDFRYGPPQRQL